MNRGDGEGESYLSIGLGGVAASSPSSSSSESEILEAKVTADSLSAPTASVSPSAVTSSTLPPLGRLSLKSRRTDGYTDTNTPDGQYIWGGLSAATVPSICSLPSGEPPHTAAVRMTEVTPNQLSSPDQPAPYCLHSLSRSLSGHQRRACRPRPPRWNLGRSTEGQPGWHHITLGGGCHTLACTQAPHNNMCRRARLGVWCMSSTANDREVFQLQWVTNLPQGGLARPPPLLWRSARPP